MVQRPPKSVRLSEQDEERSFEIADQLGLTWHGWITRLIRWSNERPIRQIKQILETEDQERIS